jgi:acetyl esterase/lipase
LKENIVFFIHGGSWKHGNAKLFRFVGKYFAKQGLEVIIPTYRVVPNNHFPDQINDVFLAIKKSIDTIEKSNHKKIIVIGQSAGAQLGALLVLNPNKQSEYGLPKRIFSGFISISGPLDFSVSKYAKSIINDYVNMEELKEEANPINYIKKNLDLPVFCIHGDRDQTCEIENSINFINKLKKYNKNKSEFVRIKRGYHLDLVNIFLGKLKDQIDLEVILENF